MARASSAFSVRTSSCSRETSRETVQMKSECEVGRRISDRKCPTPIGNITASLPRGRHRPSRIAGAPQKAEGSAFLRSAAHSGLEHLQRWSAVVPVHVAPDCRPQRTVDNSIARLQTVPCAVPVFLALPSHHQSLKQLLEFHLQQSVAIAHRLVFESCPPLRDDSSS